MLLVDADRKSAEQMLNHAREKFEELVSRRGLPPEARYQSGMVVTDAPPESADEIIWAVDQDLRRAKS